MIDRTYPLDAVPDAMRHLEAGKPEASSSSPSDELRIVAAVVSPKGSFPRTERTLLRFAARMWWTIRPPRCFRRRRGRGGGGVRDSPCVPAACVVWRGVVCERRLRRRTRGRRRSTASCASSPRMRRGRRMRSASAWAPRCWLVWMAAPTLLVSMLRSTPVRFGNWSSSLCIDVA